MPNGRIQKWICPTCGRNFARKNQSHSCELYSLKEHHFKKGTASTIQLYNRFISIFKKFKPILIEPLKNIIAIKKNSQFLTIQIQKNALKIIFRSYTLFSSPRLNVIPVQEKMHYYQFKIQKLDEIDEELINWMTQSYMEN
ncbi:DUF5655 domain-containing protein [Promethearchaeum syntrophicum]|uniref:DUF5655 domain-containing protein n=1 Tax=Promethearchaeum syntrophicum TaxID=2594042 RepID=A0A5B9DGU7_9ARCH|nr:DUF5655 domain-containing protein [Candidatus Prometheoarchaeum syntrophicum]QEE17946.1 hypothetical protein DSAG12_03784 [Candidatus Prometheoarchaeum syntrophicum]